MKISKKAKTMDKNVLQRQVEMSATRISKMGARIFRRKDPAAAKLFDELI